MSHEETRLSRRVESDAGGNGGVVEAMVEWWRRWWKPRTDGPTARRERERVRGIGPLGLEAPDGDHERRSPSS